jgi:Protein of unknown function (DUF1360)
VTEAPETTIANDTDNGTPGDPGAAHEHRPIGGYLVLTGTFFAVSATALLAARAAGKEPPAKVSAWDVLLAGAATHKLSRLITKDKVTGALRSPFVDYQGRDGHGEVSEQARGSGLQRAIGELLTCPYCVGQWVAAGVGIGTVAAPRFTRLVTFVYAAETVGDFLQLAYRTAEDSTSG